MSDPIVTKLKTIYEEKGITQCEMKWPHECNPGWLTFAHKKKRREYKLCPEKLAQFDQTLLLCIVAHQMIEFDRELTKKIFNELRS